MVESSKQSIGVPNITQLPRVDSSEVDGFFQASTQLEAEALADFQNRDEAEFTRKGLIDGQKGEFNRDLLYAPTIRGRNYTQAAQKSYIDTIELNTITTFQEITERNRNDSLTAEKEMEGYLNGVVQGMPGPVRERLGQTYLLKGQIKANALVSEIQGRERKVEDARQEASVVALDIAAAKETPQYARGAASLDQDIQRKNLAALLEHWTDLKSRNNTTMIDINGVEEPVFSEGQKLKSEEIFLADASDAYIKQSFRNAPDKDEYLRRFAAGEIDYVLKDENGTVVIDLRPLGGDKQESLRNWMEARIRERNSARNTEKTAARKLINQLISNIKADGSVDDEQMANARILANQHGLEGEFQRLQSWDNTATKMRLMKTFGPTERADAIQAQRAVLEKKRQLGGAISKDEADQLEAMEGLHKDMLDGEAKDPMATANRYGTVVLAPIDLNNPDSVNLRKAQAQTVRDKNGGIIQHYTRQERDVLNQGFANPEVSSKDKVDFLTQLGNWGDETGAVGLELSKNSPNLGHQVGLMNQGVPRETHRLIFEGERAIKTGQRFMSMNDNAASPTFDAMATAFRLSGQTRTNVRNAAEAIYHTLTFEEGGDTAVIDEERLIISIQMASGATMDGDVAIGGIGEVKGSNIVVPSDVPAADADTYFDQFTNLDYSMMAMDGMEPFQINSDGERVPVDIVKLFEDNDDARFISIGEGLYVIATDEAGDEFLAAPAEPNHILAARRQGLYVMDTGQLPSDRHEEYLDRAESFFPTKEQLFPAPPEGAVRGPLERPAVEENPLGKAILDSVLPSREELDAEIEEEIAEIRKKSEELQRNTEAFNNLPAKRQTPERRAALKRRSVVLGKKIKALKDRLKKRKD